MFFPDIAEKAMIARPTRVMGKVIDGENPDLTLRILNPLTPSAKTSNIAA